MKTDTVVRFFAPEHWGQLERFRRLCGSTFTFSKREGRSVTGAENHFHKAQLLRSLAERARPNLLLDKQELHEKGFTAANNSQEFAALMETILLEIYSTLDCTRKTLQAVYKNTRGLRDSTSHLFESLQKDESAIGLPAAIVHAIRQATWFERLRQIRTELAHFDTGSCHLDEKSNLISYWHEGLPGVDEKPFIIEDILGYIDETISAANHFLGLIFLELNSLLGTNPQQQFCGIFNGRIYARQIIPLKSLTFDSGICESHAWFEQSENPTCVFASTCGAYKRAKGLLPPE